MADPENALHNPDIEFCRKSRVEIWPRMSSQSLRTCATVEWVAPMPPKVAIRCRILHHSLISSVTGRPVVRIAPTVNELFTDREEAQVMLRML